MNVTVGVLRMYVRLNVDVETRRWQQSISTYVKMAESKWLPKISMDTKKYNTKVNVTVMSANKL